MSDSRTKRTRWECSWECKSSGRAYWVSPRQWMYHDVRRKTRSREGSDLYPVVGAAKNSGARWHRQIHNSFRVRILSAGRCQGPSHGPTKRAPRAPCTYSPSRGCNHERDTSPLSILLRYQPKRPCLYTRTRAVGIFACQTSYIVPN